MKKWLLLAVLALLLVVLPIVFVSIDSVSDSKVVKDDPHYEEGVRPVVITTDSSPIKVRISAKLSFDLSKAKYDEDEEINILCQHTARHAILMERTEPSCKIKKYDKKTLCGFLIASAEKVYQQRQKKLKEGIDQDVIVSGDWRLICK